MCVFGQEAPADLKKLIAPMFHIRFVEDYLHWPQAKTCSTWVFCLTVFVYWKRWMIFDECAKKQKSFHDKLRDAGLGSKTLDAGSSNTLSFPFLVFRPRTMDQLLRMRENFQTGGEANVAVHGSLKEKGRLCRPRHLRFIWYSKHEWYWFLRV